MNHKRWTSKQKSLFKLYFTNEDAKENGVSIKKVINSTWEYHLKWEEFYNIIRKYSPEIDHFSKADKVELINYKENNYLIVKIYNWTYLCINLDKKEVVNFGPDLYPFNENFFIDNFDEKKVKKTEAFYFSIDFLNDGLLEIIKFTQKNKNLFLTDSGFTYRIEEDELMTFLNFNTQKGNITLYFGNKYMIDDTNYIYIDNNLSLREVSNSIENTNKLKKMCTKLKNIKIPIDVIPNFLLDNIRYHELTDKVSTSELASI